MTRWPNLWSLLTGIDMPPVDPREQARQDYEAAVERRDTRAIGDAWLKLRDATNAALAGDA